jgi:antitoxin component YwqK of YwqJK toxin-antitoxin module
MTSLLFSSCEKKTVIESELDSVGIKPETFKLIDTTFYKNKKVKCLRLVNSTTEYTDVFFYESGKKKSIKPVKNNQCHNKYIDWYENGAIKHEREYILGNQIGKNIEYRQNGNLKQLFDIEKKESTTYWENGKPKFMFAENGSQYYYYYNGNLIEKYDKTNKDEYLVKYYNENGEVKFSGKFKLNILYKNEKKYTGKIICYFNNGKISHFEEVLNGVPNGKFYGYYGNGIIKFESETKNEKEIYYKCYYENGKVNFIRDGIKNTFTQWDKNGKLIK